MKRILCAALLFCALPLHGADPVQNAVPAVDRSTDTPKPDLRTNLEKLSDSSPAVRRNAVIYLGAEKKKSNVTALLPMLNDPDKQVRRVTVNALGQIGDARAVEPLTGLYKKDADMSVRVSCLIALGDLKAMTAVPLLTRVLKDPMPMYRAEAVKALGKIGNPESFSHIVTMLDDSAEGVKIAAAQVCAARHIKSAEKSLIKMAADSIPVVRREAVITLGEIGSDASRAVIEPLAQDADPSVAQAAQAALARLDARMAARQKSAQ